MGKTMDEILADGYEKAYKAGYEKFFAKYYAESYAESYVEGFLEGKAEYRAEGAAVLLIKNVNTVMKNMLQSLNEALKTLGITEQEYNNALELLKKIT